MKPQPKFVTRLFAAIDGYAGLKAQSEKHALDLSRSARETVKPLIEHYNGVWIYEKDGEIFANFKLPEKAEKTALEIQRTLKVEPEIYSPIILFIKLFSNIIGEKNSKKSMEIFTIISKVS